MADSKLFLQLKREMVVLVHSLIRYFPLEQLEWEEQWNVPSGFPVTLKGETAHCNQFELASSPSMPPCSYSSANLMSVCIEMFKVTQD